MLKYFLLGTTVAIASPALAQETPAPAEQPAQTQETPPAPEPATPTADPASSQDATAQSAQPATPAQPTQPAAQAAQATPTEPAQPAQQPPQAAQAAPATTSDQVGQVVNVEFAKYDADKNGTLDKTEFAAWMNVLRKAADPSLQEASPANQQWLTAAFTQADTDKTASITPVELTAFLTPKTPPAS